MKNRSDASHEEPMGIVISGGHALVEQAPRFSAYIWAPAPEEETTGEAVAA
jgi:hypothetical protein